MKKGWVCRRALEKAKKWFDKSRRLPQLPSEVVEGLASSPSIILYSLQPWGGPNIHQWDFHGHHVLGRVNMSPEQAKTAIAALNAAVSMGDATIMSMCGINPRHAMAFKVGSDAYDILICYECSQLQVYKNDQFLPFQGMIGGTPVAFNGLLKSAGVPLADGSAPQKTIYPALKKSYAEEAKVALKLAEEGDVQAQDVLAKMFMNGRGVKKDEAKGIDWMRKSLRLAPDDPKFQVILGIDGTERHRSMAETRLHQSNETISASRGSGQRWRLITALGSSMTGGREFPRTLRKPWSGSDNLLRMDTC